MAQQHHQQYPPPQRAFSPPQRTDSPHRGPPGPYPPPIKRQPASPSNQSPYGSPGMANIQLPNQVFSAPYYGSQTNGNTPYTPYNPNNHYGSPANTASNPPRPYGHQAAPTYNPSTSYNPSNSYPSPNVNGTHNYNTMNPAQTSMPSQSQAGATGGMGPPARPIDKPTDINELGDVMVGSGIDLREEEAALLHSYGKQRQDAGYGTSSFGTYAPPKENLYSNNVPGDRGSFYGAGSFNQAPEPERSAEDLADEIRRKSLRRKAEIHSYHLNNPFLSSGCLHKRLNKQALSMQVSIPRAGLLKSAPGRPATEIAIQGPDNNPVMKLVHGEDLVGIDAPLVELLSLLSLATEERIRGFVEDSATVAKGRRIGAHGVVPADLNDLAIPTGSSEAVAGLPTPGNSAVSEKSNPLKRSYSEVNQPLTPISDNGQIPPTIAFSNSVAQALQKITKTERAQEEERLAKRQRRAAGAGGSSTNGVSGSGTLGEVAPEADSKKAGKAKEKLDATARKATEAQQHAATTKTMNMALGLSGTMGKKLSWMTKGADAAPSNPYAKKPESSAQTPKTNAPGGNTPGSSLPKNRLFGEFREDKETGSGIQLRDLVSVLEHDGKEKKALQRAYGRFGLVKR